MRIRIKNYISFFVLIFLLPVLLLCVGASLPRLYGESYYAQLAEMDQRLTTTQGSRLILIGGSNVAFGIDVSLLEELMGQAGYNYTVCPYGLYAAVGTSAMLELSAGVLREGDIVVLALEPTSETMSTYFGANAFWKCAESSPGLLTRLNGKQTSAVWGGYIGYLQERAAICRLGDFPRAAGVYARSAFDENCNMSYFRAGNTMALGYDVSSPIDLASVSVEGDFAEEMNEYCRTAAQRGAAVYLSFSPMNRSAIADLSDEAVDAYFNTCSTAFGCLIISNPNDYIMDSGWFYDSNFHLNTAGAQMRTYTLAGDLLAQLGYYRKPAYTAPAMPVSIAVSADNDADPTLFTYRAIGENGWLISGLTDVGLTATSLTVPSSVEGRPVVGFTSDALFEAASLEELRIPQNVEFLPSGLFRNCGSLTRLVLEHTAFPCDIAGDTFDGAPQIRVFVPASSYSFYRDGYGCEVSPWANELDRIFTY